MAIVSGIWWEEERGMGGMYFRQHLCVGVIVVCDSLCVIVIVGVIVIVCV
jgi:hypothetical protein